MSASKYLEQIRKYESPNVTFIDDAGDWPIVWESASGTRVVDTEGREYTDLTGAFGVAVTGHANPNVVAAGQNQMEKLLHAMGDVHPHRLKGELCRSLSAWTFERWSASFTQTPHEFGRAILTGSGFEAIESALKSAFLATGKKNILAFEGGYHGLGYGALMATHRSDFRSPFLDQIGGQTRWVPFPESPDLAADVLGSIRHHFESGQFGTAVIEPVQARGGIRIPSPGFLKSLRDLCDEFGVILVFDEIYTGFGRTGHWFGCEIEMVMPDIVCLGKALTGGFPLSACVGRSQVMESAWPESKGEAIHTSTFLGHPVGCAMALAQLEELRSLDALTLVQKSGDFLREHLRMNFTSSEFRIRGLGLMMGLEVINDGGARVWKTVQNALKDGFIFLPCGESGSVLSWTPPYIISREELESSVQSVRRWIL